MGKGWSIFFGAVMMGCAGLFVAAPFVRGWWMPEGVSTHAGAIDTLFYTILGVTGFFFFLTEALLCYFMYVYAGRPTRVDTNAPGLPTPVQPLVDVLRLFPKFFHDQHRVEMAWTVVPAVILLYIAFAQVGTWRDVKYQSRNPQIVGDAAPLQVAVSARQFEWRMRYPSPERFKGWLGKKDDADVKADADSFARTPQADDVYTVNELHVWKGHPAVAHVSTRDVIHSFNLPHFRVKQDALPGRTIPVWFTPTRANTRWDEARQQYVDGINPETGQPDSAYLYDIPCAELCGWGHFQMIGRVFVHDSEAAFHQWLTRAAGRTHQRTGDR